MQRCLVPFCIAGALLCSHHAAAQLTPLGTPTLPNGAAEIAVLSVNPNNQDTYFTYNHAVLRLNFTTPVPLRPLTATPWQYTVVAGNLRAHVQRSVFMQDPTDGPIAIIPIVNVMRHATVGLPSNCDLIFNPATSLNAVLQAKQSLPTTTELLLDFSYIFPITKQAYFLQYGTVPDHAIDATTVPGYDGYLYDTDASRFLVATDFMTLYNLKTYKAGLGKLIAVLQVKQATLPIAIDGVGATTRQADMATQILTIERTITVNQIMAGLLEYAALMP